jgi:putative hydrolase
LLALKHWGIVALPGVEITHVPKEAIEKIAEAAIEQGALIIVVHGETISEPVEPGTNLQTAKIPLIDILAHPGLITKEEAKYCKLNNTFVEITSHRNHSKTNGIVAKIGREEKVDFIQNTDTHVPDNMLILEEAEEFLKATGFNENEINKILQENVRKLLKNIYEKL